MSMMLEEARRYAAMGYSVIPLRSHGKEPLIKWQEFTARKATETELSTWFMSGENNLGLVAGASSGFVVVDVDGAEGLVSAKELNLQSTTVSLTGKGMQYFYQAPYPSPKNAVRILPGIDIRSDGGYICAPPSIHPNGKRYVWLLGPTKDLPPFPAVLVDFVKQKDSGSISQREPPLIAQKLSTDYGSWVKDALESLKEGNRNDTFARVIGKLHHSGLDKTTIWALLLPYAKSSGLDDAEFNRILQSITRYTTQVSAECAASSAEQFLSDSTPVAWLCDPICARGSFGFTAGLPESYKTWLLMDFAIECARGGGLWLGLFPVVGGRALFIDQERPATETRRRFRALLAGKSLSASDLRSSLFIRAGTTTRLDINESFNAFKRELAEIRPDVVLVDSFATFHSTDENDRTGMQRVLERVKELRAEFGCTIIFVEHESKHAFSDGRDGITPSASRMLGSIGKVAASEFVLTVRRTDPQTCAVHHTKATQGPRVPSFAVHVKDVGEGTIVYAEVGKA